jgi:hippurate hydrolase
MANVDTVDILVKGYGGHGAYPHRTIDPVVIAANVVVQLQTIVSRQVPPHDAAVVTVGSIHGGTKHNIIPNEVRLQLTVRSYSDETRKLLLDSIARVSRGVAAAAGATGDLAPDVSENDEFTPSTYNTPELVERSVAAMRSILGAENVIRMEPKTWGEDFGRYGRAEPRIPIFMFTLGAQPRALFAASQQEGGPRLPALHSSQFAPEPEPTLKTGVQAMSAAAMDLLKKD